MGLVDYSESDSSGSEAGNHPKRIQKPKESQSHIATPKKPFQKVVDRSNPGKIVVSLPQSATAGSSVSDTDEPPTKRARTAGSGAFSGFNSFLPPPKNVGKTLPSASAATSRPGVNLKTSAAPGFSRDIYDDDGGDTGNAPHPGGLNLPPPKTQTDAAAPTIPDGQKPAEEVKLVGKPLMFRPLSVGMNNKKKKNKPKEPKPVNATSTAVTGAPPLPQSSPASSAPTTSDPPKKKISLFSMHTEETSDPRPSLNGTYEPLFETNSFPAPDSAAASYYQPSHSGTAASLGATESLDTVADDLNLSAAARRELFGRGGGNFAAKKVVNFNMDKEYQHNESVRAAGDQQIHNPVRALQSGKHSLKQLVQNVANQRDALEDSFAKGRSNRKEASNRYGW